MAFQTSHPDVFFSLSAKTWNCYESVSYPIIQAYCAALIPQLHGSTARWSVDGCAWQRPMRRKSFTRWWFQRFHIFISNFGDMIQFDLYFSHGLKPPASYEMTLGKQWQLAENSSLGSLSLQFGKAFTPNYSLQCRHTQHVVWHQQEHQFLPGQWLNFQLVGISYLVVKIKYKLLFQGPLAG